MNGAETYPSQMPASLSGGSGTSVGYTLTGCSVGESISVTVDFGVEIPEESRIYKVDASGWTEISDSVISGSTTTYTITDNDGILDQDPVGGVITDPVAFAIPVTSAVPTLPPWALCVLAGISGLLGARQLRK